MNKLSCLYCIWRNYFYLVLPKTSIYKRSPEIENCSLSDTEYVWVMCTLTALFQTRMCSMRDDSMRESPPQCVRPVIFMYVWNRIHVCNGAAVLYTVTSNLPVHLLRHEMFKTFLCKTTLMALLKRLSCVVYNKGKLKLLSPTSLLGSIANCEKSVLIITPTRCTNFSNLFLE